MAVICKPVKGHEKYEVSNTGSVRNKKTGKHLSPIPSRRGAGLRVTLDGRERCYVHRLVVDSFYDLDIFSVLVVHYDGDVNNNNLYNLNVVEKGLGKRAGRPKILA